MDKTLVNSGVTWVDTFGVIVAYNIANNLLVTLDHDARELWLAIAKGREYSKTPAAELTLQEFRSYGLLA